MRLRARTIDAAVEAAMAEADALAVTETEAALAAIPAPWDKPQEDEDKDNADTTTTAEADTAADPLAVIPTSWGAPWHDDAATITAPKPAAQAPPKALTRPPAKQDKTNRRRNLTRGFVTLGTVFALGIGGMEAFTGAGQPSGAPGTELAGAGPAVSTPIDDAAWVQQAQAQVNWANTQVNELNNAQSYIVSKHPQWQQVPAYADAMKALDDQKSVLEQRIAAIQPGLTAATQQLPSVQAAYLHDVQVIKQYNDASVAAQPQPGAGANPAQSPAAGAPNPQAGAVQQVQQAAKSLANSVTALEDQVNTAKKQLLPDTEQRQQEQTNKQLHDKAVALADTNNPPDNNDTSGTTTTPTTTGDNKQQRAERDQINPDVPTGPTTSLLLPDLTPKSQAHSQIHHTQQDGANQTTVWPGAPAPQVQHAQPATPPAQQAQPAPAPAPAPAVVVNVGNDTASGTTASSDPNTVDLSRQFAPTSQSKPSSQPSSPSSSSTTHSSPSGSTSSHSSPSGSTSTSTSSSSHSSTSSGTHAYKVNESYSGLTLAGLAATTGVSLSELEALNPTIANRMRNGSNGIYNNTTIHLPANANTSHLPSSLTRVS